jgi:HEAT repeat protein
MAKGGKRVEEDPGYQKMLEKLEQVEPGIAMEPQENRFQMHLKQGKKGEEAIQKGLASEDPQIRMDAAEALGIMKAWSALASLKKVAQGDSDGQVRQNAAIALIQIGGDALLAEVTKNLRDEDPEVVAHAAVTLGRVGDRRVVPNLLEAFQTEDPYIGSAIAWALGRLGDSRAVSWLAAALENDFAAANVAEALGRIGDPEAIPVLMRVLEMPNDDTRAYAARALGMLREPSGLKGVRAHTWLERKEQMIDALKVAVEDRSPKVRVFASIALFELGVKAAGKELINMLKQM